MLFLLLAGAGFLIWVWTTCFAEPPVLAGEPAIHAEVLSTVDGRVHFGESWFEARLGRSLLYLEGDPYSIGYANARMTSDWIFEQERELIATVREFLPGTLEFWGVTLLVLTNNRSLPSYVPLEYQYEILGLAEGSEDPLPHMGPRYHRILNYHAAHDISHWVWDKPVVGCNAFAAVGDWTESGHLILGRNFDFEAGRRFDENKIIGLYRPESGCAFLSIAWPGMAGAVTGINDERIFCSINGAHSADRGRIGTPASLVVRQVLQYATTLEEATAIIRDAQVFVADSYLLADGKTGQAVVVEKTPARSGVRGMQGGLLLQSNHFETDELAVDSGNLDYMQVGTSIARHGRLRELVEGERGSLDPGSAVAIMRDRKGVGGLELAPGHRSSLCAVIATHSVVADVTAGTLWVSRGPHQLGEFDPYSIEDFGTAGEALPADPALGDGTHSTLVEVRAVLERLEEEFEDTGRLSDTSLAELARSADRLPPLPALLRLWGRALEASGDPESALERFREAAEARPPFRVDREAVEAAIHRLGD